MTPFETVQLVLRIALGLVFVGMGALHFVPGPARGMAAMIPPAMRVVSPRALVAFTGLCELAGGIGLVVPATRVAAAICLVVRPAMPVELIVAKQRNGPVGSVDLVFLAEYTRFESRAKGDW